MVTAVDAVGVGADGVAADVAAGVGGSPPALIGSLVDRCFGDCATVRIKAATAAPSSSIADAPTHVGIVTVRLVCTASSWSSSPRAPLAGLAVRSGGPVPTLDGRLLWQSPALSAPRSTAPA